MALVGAELLDRPEARRHAYEIARSLDRQKGPVSRTLARMAAVGWLTDEWEGEQATRQHSRPARHYYTLTDLGARELTAICRRVAATAPDNDDVLRRFAQRDRLGEGFSGRGTP